MYTMGIFLFWKKKQFDGINFHPSLTKIHLDTVRHKANHEELRNYPVKDFYWSNE